MIKDIAYNAILGEELLILKSDTNLAYLRFFHHGHFLSPSWKYGVIEGPESACFLGYASTLRPVTDNIGQT